MPTPKRYVPDYGQPWKAVQRIKGGSWDIVNYIGRTVATGIGTYGEAQLIVSKINENRGLPCHAQSHGSV